MSQLERLERRVAIRSATLVVAVKAYNDYVYALEPGRFPYPRSAIIEETMDTLRNAIYEIKIHLAEAERSLIEYKLV